MQVLLGKMGTRSRVLYLIACLLTAAIYPKLMDRILLDFNPVVVAMLNVRNLMMIFIFLLIMVGPASPPALSPGDTESAS